MNDNPMTLALTEAAKVVGRVDLSKYTKTTTFDKPKAKEGEVSKADLDALEKVLDRLFAHYKIDIEFTKHFAERMNDARNIEQITIQELNALFQKAHSKIGGTLAKQKDIEAVLTDLQSKINVPFVLKADGKGGLELVAKTIMRKKNFQTSNKKFTVEMSFAEFLGEMMEPDAIRKDAADAADFIKNELTRMFPGQEVVSFLKENLGMHMIVAVYQARKGADRLAVMNAPTSAQLIMHLSNSFGKEVPMGKFSMIKNVIRSPEGAKVMYRNINGNSPMDVAKKVVAWFSKNREAFVLPGAPAR